MLESGATVSSIRFAGAWGSERALSCYLQEAKSAASLLSIEGPAARRLEQALTEFEFYKRPPQAPLPPGDQAMDPENAMTVLTQACMQYVIVSGGPALLLNAKGEQLDEIRRSHGRSDALKIAKKAIQIRDLAEELEKELM